MKSYYDTDYVSICYSEDAHAIVCEWRIPLMSDEFRMGMGHFLSAIEHFKTGKIIIDTRLSGTLHPNDQYWAVTEWTEKALRIGYSHVAFLMAEDIYSRMAVEDGVEQIRMKVTVSYFDSPEEALAWIKTV